MPFEAKSDLRVATVAESTYSYALALGCAALVLVDLALLIWRGVSLVRHYDLSWTTGMEEIDIYAVWRAAHRLAVYSWPSQPLDSPSLHNFLFYHSYGLFGRALGGSVPDIMLYDRLLTTCFLVAGALGELRLLKLVLGKEFIRSRFLLVAAVITVTWFGSGFVRWFAYTVRPDPSGMAYETWGLVCAATALSDRGSRAERRRNHYLLAASVLFFLAWASKQTLISYFLGSVGFLVVTRRVRTAARLALPFCVLVGVTLLVAGSNYRVATLSVPSWSPLLPAQLAFVMWRAAYPNLFMWIPPIVALALWRGVRDRNQIGGVPELTGLLVACLLVSVPLDLVTAAKAGSYVYYLWESFLLFGAFLCLREQQAFELPNARRLAWTCTVLAALASTLTGSAIQLFLPGRYSMLDLATPASAKLTREAVQEIEQLPAPVLVQNLTLALLSQPATRTSPPTLIDTFVYTAGNGRNQFADRIRALLDKGYFRSIVADQLDGFGWLKAGHSLGMIPCRAADDNALVQLHQRVIVRAK